MADAPSKEEPNEPKNNLKSKVYTVIFEADTPAGKAFDVVLFIAIGLSVMVVMLESVKPIRANYGDLLTALEWILTILFSLEYVLRLWCVRRPLQYAKSFFGIVDIVSVIPTYLSLFFAGTQYLLIVRALRLLRVFRVLKLGHYLGEAEVLGRALKASIPKITVFLGVVLTGAMIVGAAMYLIEGPESGFTSIPLGVYWAIVTMTTVGYGDIAPQTVPGQSLAALVMIMGYGILAVPTGIVSAELFSSAKPKEQTTQACPACVKHGHDPDAQFCKHCGASLEY